MMNRSCCFYLTVLFIFALPGYDYKTGATHAATFAPDGRICRAGEELTEPYIIVLGTVQDGGSPHAGCKKNCCSNLFAHPDPLRKVVSLGLADPATGSSWMFEASPDFTTQAKALTSLGAPGHKETPDGIFLTHAHIGHYTGLMYLAREAMNAPAVSVYAMPRMKSYLEGNGPWSQLVTLNNIRLEPLQAGVSVNITRSISVTPFAVPHRDEFSETVGYVISGPSKKLMFIPDIDKWSKRKEVLADEIKKVDYALLDGTFYDGEEVPGRNLSEIPHPFVTETMELLKELPASEKNKIWFIHFNHTNPLLNASGKQAQYVLSQGYHIAAMHTKLTL